LNSNQGGLCGSTTIYPVHVENHDCLSRGVQVTSAA
jgi:hypothetical protein